MDPGNENSAREAAAIIDLDPDFEPQSRPRSCTWPLPRPELTTEPREPSVVEPSLGEKVHTEGHSEPILLPSRLPEPAGGPQPGILGAVTVLGREAPAGMPGEISHMQNSSARPLKAPRRSD